MARLYRHLSSFSRLILFDKRGTGLSDRANEAFTLETRMDDVRAVMDAVGSEFAALVGVSEGGPMTLLFAATYPERPLAAVVYGGYAKGSWASDYTWEPTLDEILPRTRFRPDTRLDRGGQDVGSSGGPRGGRGSCASAITDTVRDVSLEVRCGLHTGECELVEGKLGGIAVHIGARVAAQARPGEVLVSSTVKDLVAGSGIRFQGRGSAELKGVPGEWRLYAVERDEAG